MAFPNQGPEQAETPTGGGSGEMAVLERIRTVLERQASPPAGETWIGDDAAVVRVPGDRVVLATDATVAGVHADLALVGLDDLGWKAVTSTVSDIAAMGARPRHALVVLCAPSGTDMDLLNAGIAQASARWRCPVVGGDLSAADDVVVAVSVVGSLDDGPPAVRRDGASPGDTLMLTGPVGGSAAGLARLRDARRARGRPATEPAVPGAEASRGQARPPVPPAVVAALVGAHRRPLARLEEGTVARLAGATAMIDVSDGLALDLHRLADASGIGFRLESVPVAAGATEEEALSGGEDYELVVAVPDDRVAALEQAFLAAGLRPPLTVGRCAADPAERLLAGSPLPRSGWQHRLV